VRGRERKIDRGIEREINVGERWVDVGEIVGRGEGRERGMRGGRERVRESVRGGERKTKRRGRDKEGGEEGERARQIGGVETKREREPLP
jgi:hypothetical protein